MARLIDGGFPDAAITLSEYALDLLEASADRVDDSEGGLWDVLDQAQEIHLVACQAGSPEPLALAERLATRAVNSEYEVFHDALPTYEHLLTPAARDRYRDLLEAGR